MLYRDRNRLERLVGRLKQYRCIATRFEKRALHYLAMLGLADSAYKRPYVSRRTSKAAPVGAAKAEPVRSVLCLNYAATAVKANFLRLALASIDKAIAVNDLPPDDYERIQLHNEAARKHGDWLAGLLAMPLSTG